MKITIFSVLNIFELVARSDTFNFNVKCASDIERVSLYG